ncbi:response regulator transcription factor [Streptomyces sp. MS2.AVA.5]|uniref:Response regulator transcription factor n=1 Tax=Streptomyces achmelvichensis TaxID=3134111 RepID=A0ACC6Q907_9ACTN
MARVLLIEDDAAVRKAVTLALKRRGHEVETANSGETGILVLERYRPDLVMLDLMLPNMSGLEVCRRIRESKQVPIIIISARDDEVDVVVGLSAGADDYITKPANGEVIEARIQAVLRRVAPGSSAHAAAPQTAEVESIRDLDIDRTTLMVAKGGTHVPLAPSELKLLLFLSATPGRVYSRDQLLEQVWEYNFHGDVRIVDACVQRLRVKIEDNPRKPVFVQTVRGFGYRFGPVE